MFEGFRAAPTPMIEVYRPALGLPMLWPAHGSVVAVATDGTVDCALPVLPLSDPAGVARFVCSYVGLAAHAARTRNA